MAVLRGRDPGQVAAPAGEAWGAGDGCVWVEPGLMPLMPEFLSSRRRLADELIEAVAAGDRETVRTIAHKLAGSLAMYGFKDASRATRALEQAAGVEDLGDLRERCDALLALLAQAQPVARPVVPS
jgi:two-component system response regulator BaeR